MKAYSSTYNSLIFLFLLMYIKFTRVQIHDNFQLDVFEEGNFDLLDVTDYHNIGLIVSSSKAIYIGIPPIKKIVTNAKLIKYSSLITINSNYLLASCLEDSFLGKINLSTGNFESLISYSKFDPDDNIGIPQAICSLSNIDNIIFVGHSNIQGNGEIKNVTKTLFRLSIKNKDSIDAGPILDDSIEIKNCLFSKGKMESPSIRQISCEPLRIKESTNDYRLVCLYESIFTTIIDYYDGFQMTSINSEIYAVQINSDFDNYERRSEGSKEKTIDSGYRYLGFRIYKINDNYARCLTGNSLSEIYLENGETLSLIKQTDFSSSSYNLKADIDLISYNKEFTFSAQKSSYMGKKDVYSLQINQKNYPNYFKFFDYEENIIYKVQGYYDETKSQILCLYQTDNKIKYFIIDNMVSIVELGSFSHYIETYSYAVDALYDLNNLITSPELSSLGYLNVERIKYVESSFSYSYKDFGKDFYGTLMENNILIPEPNLNGKKIYNLSFIDHIENAYTRIYHLYSVLITVQTCEQTCYSCWEEFSKCTDCTNENYAILEDDSRKCYPKDHLVKGYIYDSKKKNFLNVIHLVNFVVKYHHLPLNKNALHAH